MNSNVQKPPPFEVPKAVEQSETDTPPFAKPVERSEIEKDLSREPEPVNPKGEQEKGEQSVVEVNLSPADVEDMNDDIIRGMREGAASIGGFELGNRSPVERSETNPFKPQPPNPKNPFKKEVPKTVEPEAKLMDVPIGTPTWRELVKFVMDNGQYVRRVRYPNPPKNVEGAKVDGPWVYIDTIWQGVPVFNGAECEIEHVQFGWAKWEDCQL